MKRKIILEHKCALGDTVVMTACVRDLLLQYPDDYEVYVDTNFPALWKSVKTPTDNSVPRYVLDYGPYILRGNREPFHFLRSFHEILSEQLGISVPVLFPYGDIELDDELKNRRPISGRYWCFLAGGKFDFTVKIWSPLYWQETIDKLNKAGIKTVQTGALHRGHFHPIINNCLNLVGRGDVRELLWLIYHADGVICPITGAMHIAAAFQKPCVVIAGGREHWWWEGYCGPVKERFGFECAEFEIEHRYLHTIGQLSCCKEGGCWKNKVTRKELDKPQYYCLNPRKDAAGNDVPECLLMIKPDMVVDAVLSYYRDGFLSYSEDSVMLEVAPDFPELLLHLKKAAKSELVFKNKITVLLIARDDKVYDLIRSILCEIPLEFLELHVFYQGQNRKIIRFLDSLKKYGDVKNFIVNNDIISIDEIIESLSDFDNTSGYAVILNNELTPHFKAISNLEGREVFADCRTVIVNPEEYSKIIKADWYTNKKFTDDNGFATVTTFNKILVLRKNILQNYSYALLSKRFSILLEVMRQQGVNIFDIDYIDSFLELSKSSSL